MLWVCSKSYHYYETTLNKLNIRSKGLKKPKLVQNGDVPPEKNLKLLDDTMYEFYIFKQKLPNKGQNSCIFQTN